MERAIIIIPARYGSTRFPGKPLAPILGKPMLKWVIEGARSSRIKRIIVATDDERIKKIAEDSGVEVVMTKEDFRSGTERVGAVASEIEAEYIINLQGDEPLIRGEMLDQLLSTLEGGDSMATLARRGSIEEYYSQHTAKVVVDKDGNALYFSRSPIPFVRDETIKPEHFLIHIGVYGFKKETLIKYLSLPESPLEKLEKLEQLRALYYGINIKVVEVQGTTRSVDIPEDIEEVEKILKEP